MTTQNTNAAAPKFFRLVCESGARSYEALGPGCNVVFDNIDHAERAARDANMVQDDRFGRVTVEECDAEGDSLDF